MSGHSHFRTIKAQKELADAKKGKVFSKLARLITIAVKEGGSDPAKNPKLKTTIEQAKRFNMPKDNVERAIKRGSGESTGEILEEFSIEGFGPGQVALILEGITDNKNRSLAEIKAILNEYGGKMAGEGAVKWMFERKGIILVQKDKFPKEELELLAIESGAEDIKEENDSHIIYTKPETLDGIKGSLEQKGVPIGSAALELVPNQEVSVSPEDKEKNQKLFEALDENDAVQEIYSNLKL